MRQLRTETEFKVNPWAENENGYLDPEKVLQSPMPRVYSLKNLGTWVCSTVKANLEHSKDPFLHTDLPSGSPIWRTGLLGKSIFLVTKETMPATYALVQESLIKVTFG